MVFALGFRVRNCLLRNMASEDVEVPLSVLEIYIHRACVENVEEVTGEFLWHPGLKYVWA